MRFKSTLLLCSLGLFALAGCSQPTTTADAGSPTSSPAVSSPAAAASAATATAAYPELLAVVTKTQTAVETQDFAKAQQEFDQFEGVWSQVEDGIKEKSGESYDAIEQDMDKVGAALRASNANDAIAALQAMGGHIQSIPQG